MRWLISLSAALILAGPGQILAQGTITGRVVDARTNQPVTSAQISIPGMDLGTLTNAAGVYSLSNVPAGVHTVQAIRIGHRTETASVTVAAGVSAQLDFRLTEEALALDEIVVTGTVGGTQRRAIGNSVSRLETESLTQSLTPMNVGDLLSGRAPGVVLETTGGNLGSSPSITIRGASTLSLASQPLVYIDGIRADNRRNTGNRGGQSGIGVSRMNDINPADIESIEVIKGPAAATLYGTEASNGVIQIITKKGRVGRPEFTFSTTQGQNWLQDPSKRWPDTWEMINGEVVVLDMIEREDANGTPLLRNGNVRNFGVNVRGGSETIRYYLSGAFDNEEGVMQGEESKRVTARANLDMTVTENLRMNVSSGLTTSKLTFPAFGMPTTAIPRDCTAARPRCYTPWEITERDVDQFQDADRFTNSFQFEHRPAEWFNHRLTLGLDVSREYDVRLQLKADSVSAQYYTLQTATGSRSDRRVDVDNFTADYSASVIRPLTSSFTSTTSIGVQYFRNGWSYTAASGTGFAGRGLSTINALGSKTSTGDYAQTNSAGMFVQEQIGWNDRVFLTGGLRADDHSAFGDEFSLVIYPKVSASWVIGEESFMQNFSWLDQLLLRAAYGESGQAPARFSSLRTYSTIPTASGASGFLPEGIGNPDLGPERGQELEVGFDMSTLDGRLTAEFTHYRQSVKDAILARNVAPSEGFAGTRYVNAGEITNRGVEVVVGARPFEFRGVSLDLTANLSHNDNKIQSLGEDTQITVDPWVSHVVGHPVGSYFMRNPVSAQFDSIWRPIDPQCSGGPQNNNQPVPCADAPKVYLGPPNYPTEATFGASLNIGERLNLRALLVSKRGAVRENVHYRANCSNRSACELALFPENFPPELVARRQLYPEMATYAIQTGTFTRLSEVGMSYLIPENWLAGFRVTRGSVSVSMRNLYLWTDYGKVGNGGGWDPEVYSSFPELGEEGGNIRREQRGIIPPTQNLLITINLTY